MSGVNAIAAERSRHVSLAHGGDTDEFDKSNTRNDWIAYITAYAAQGADKIQSHPSSVAEFRKAMVEVGALAAAAIDSVDCGNLL